MLEFGPGIQILMILLEDFIRENTFLFVYRDDYYNLHSDMKEMAEIIVAKHNAGKLGTARMHWSPIYYFFSEV